MPKYGNPADPNTQDYHKHRRYCKYHGVEVSWEEYLDSVSPGSKYGPPGTPGNSKLAHRHRSWIRRNGPCTWEEYVRMSRLSDELSAERIKERAERVREKFARLGLVA